MDTPTITRKYAQAFKSTDQEHVMWLKSLHDATQNEKSVDKILVNNPFGVTITKKEMLEFINIQFVLAMKYAMNVLEGQAWVPVQNI
jgi:23S rRNA G2445 N2-methylase RlmL